MPLVQSLKKEVRELTPRMQKFRKAIQAYNVYISFVKRIHNHISDALSRSPVGGPEAMEQTLRIFGGHASYAYNRVVSCIKGEICKEVIEDPALDEMWEAAELDEGYQSVAETIKKKVDKEVYKTLSKAAIFEYIGYGVERMSVIEKGNTKILLMDQTRIVVPLTMRKKLLEREHLAHSGVTKMSNRIEAKYFWPGIEADVKRMVEACESCQLHQRAQRREPNRPALEHVSLPMQAIGIDFLERLGCKYLLLMDHFSRLPMYANMGYGTDTDHTVRQLKRWFATFGMSRSIRCDNGPPFLQQGVQGVL